MSYSFSARGATKAEVLQKVSESLDNVVSGQPIHKADRAQAQAAVEAFLAIVPDDASDKDFNANVSGSVGWQEGDVVTSVGFNVSVTLVAKEKAA